MESLTLYQSRSRQAGVLRSLEGVLERVELVVDDRGEAPWSDECFECTLSVLRPAGFLLLIRSREFTISWGLSSC
jgi:hypothetical protein